MYIGLEQFLNCHISEEDERFHLSCLEVVVTMEYGFSEMYFDRERAYKEGFGDTYKRVAKGGWFSEDIDGSFYPSSEMIISLLGKTFSLAYYAKSKRRNGFDEIARIYSIETNSHVEFYIAALSNVIHKYSEKAETNKENISSFFRKMDSEIEELSLSNEEIGKHYSVEPLSFYWNNYLENRHYRYSNLKEDFTYIKRCVILKRQREYVFNFIKNLEDNRIYTRIFDSEINRDDLLDLLRRLLEEESDSFKNYAYIDLEKLNKLRLARRMIEEPLKEVINSKVNFISTQL